MSAPTDHTIILITGAAGGLGLATCEALLKSTVTNYIILLSARSLSKAEAAVKSLEDQNNTNHQLRPVELDIDDEASVDQLFDEVKAKYGRLDVLVNNAASHQDFNIAKGVLSTRQAFLSSFTTNVISTHTLTSIFIPLLLLSPHSTRRILFISSGISSLSTHNDQSIPINKPAQPGWPKPYNFNVSTYRTSKTAMNMMILEWRRVLSGDGVGIYVVDPGWLATELGGGNAVAMKGMGAEDPKVGGEFVKDVVEGKRDDDEGKMVSRSGVIPW